MDRATTGPPATTKTEAEAGGLRAGARARKGRSNTSSRRPTRTGARAGQGREQPSASRQHSRTAGPARQEPVREPGTASGHSNNSSRQQEQPTPASKTPQSAAAAGTGAGAGVGTASAGYSKTGDRSSPPDQQNTPKCCSAAVALLCDREPRWEPRREPSGTGVCRASAERQSALPA
ncbi:hypothetical protein NDU88_001735 [Pleurodeles waltl]|uniref:Uncharacterized protein n=1 Tax=Pleurodeles waltl TaxID=8319 RepID=A0AAV7LGV1_PLEWA|nr:hypothetical protein NDU88_001735 [Pleurodeles waltl]